MTENENIEYELRFKKPMEQTAKAFMRFKDTQDGQTSLTWEFNPSSPYPMNIFFLFTDIDNAVGPDLQKGLNNLKSILESPE